LRAAGRRPRRDPAHQLPLPRARRAPPRARLHAEPAPVARGPGRAGRADPGAPGPGRRPVLRDDHPGGGGNQPPLTPPRLTAGRARWPGITARLSARPRPAQGPPGDGKSRPVAATPARRARSGWPPGRSTVTVRPPPGVSDKVADPPLDVTSRCTMARPRPAPGGPAPPKRRN